MSVKFHFFSNHRAYETRAYDNPEDEEHVDSFSLRKAGEFQLAHQVVHQAAFFNYVVNIVKYKLIKPTRFC